MRGGGVMRVGLVVVGCVCIWRGDSGGWVCSTSEICTHQKTNSRGFLGPKPCEHRHFTIEILPVCEFLEYVCEFVIVLIALKKICCFNVFL